MKRVKRRWSSGGLIVIVCVALTGCAQTKSPTYDVGTLGCTSVSDTALAAAASKLTVQGTLRNGMSLLGANGDRLLSAELHRPGDDPHTKGDLLTFANRGSDSSEFFAVDLNAREDSSWPGASFDVRARGARESRACADLNRGKTKAQIECEREQSSGNGQVPASASCSDR